MRGEKHEEVTEQLTSIFTAEYENELSDIPTTDTGEVYSLRLNWETLYDHSPGVAEDFLLYPQACLECAEKALLQFDKVCESSVERVNVRIGNLPEKTAVDEIGGADIGRVVEFTGVVSGVVQEQSKLLENVVTCKECGITRRVEASKRGEVDTQEVTCEECGDGEFTPESSEEKVYTDSQFVYVEQPGRKTTETTPQGCMVVELEGDLAGTITAGDYITVTGIVEKERISPLNRVSTPDKIVRAVGIQPDRDGESTAIEMTDGDISDIVTLSNSDTVQHELINRFAPEVAGEWHVKFAGLLSVFAGVPRHHGGGTYSRGGVHTVMVGGSNTAVNEIATFTAQLSPRPIKVDGGEMTKEKLLPRITRTNSSFPSHTWAVETGMLGKVTRGNAVVLNSDELRVGEQQSLAKFLQTPVREVTGEGMEALVDSDPSIVLTEKLPSEFDSSLGDPIEESDLQPPVYETVDLTVYSTELRDNDFIMSTVTDGDVSYAHEHNSDIDVEFLQKYVTYARETCFPQLTTAAERRIDDLMNELDERGGVNAYDWMVESVSRDDLIRLCKASARMRLSDAVEVHDVDVLAEFFGGLLITGDQPEERPQQYKSQGKKERDRLVNLKEVISDVEDEFDEGAPRKEIIDRGMEVGLSRDQVEHLLEQLAQKGEVYQAVKNKFRIT